MKFLCVPCDTPMTLQTVGPPDRGSLSVMYSCPECGYEIAMLTNAYETQVVQSLGVRIGPERGASAVTAANTQGGCPFASMIPAEEGSLHATGAGSAPAAAERSEGPPALEWTAAAEARLLKVPEFVRPMARTGIERFARERGAAEIDERILDAARDFFGM